MNVGFLTFINPLKYNRILDLTKSKANRTTEMTLEFEWTENFTGMGENAGYQPFLLFPQ